MLTPSSGVVAASLCRSGPAQRCKLSPVVIDVVWRSSVLRWEVAS